MIRREGAMRDMTYENHEGLDLIAPRLASVVVVLVDERGAVLQCNIFVRGHVREFFPSGSPPLARFRLESLS